MRFRVKQRGVNERANLSLGITPTCLSLASLAATTRRLSLLVISLALSLSLPTSLDSSEECLWLGHSDTFAREA
jgi:hypothetical protein